jgi:hypothetical protein
MPDVEENMAIEKDSMLAPYLVLDLTNEWGFLCERLLADLGADARTYDRRA